MSDKLIEACCITAAYDGKTVLKDISFTLSEHDFLGITGPNGCGKTTLLKVLLGLLKPAGGRVAFFSDGKPVDFIKMGYLPQINRLDRRFPISVQEVIASGLLAEKPLCRPFRQEQKERIRQVSIRMGVEKLSDRPVGDLSGGQLQRVLLGRAIVSKPQALILDEPGSYLDKDFESHLYPLLEEINKESAIIMVSHDIAALDALTKNTIHIPLSK
jgi:zinc transport system ATP-binding protein